MFFPKLVRIATLPTFTLLNKQNPGSKQDCWIPGCWDWLITNSLLCSIWATLTGLVQDEATLGSRNRYLQGPFPPNTSVGAAPEFTPSTVHSPPKQSCQPLHPLMSFHTSFLHPGACSHYPEFQPIKIHSGIAHSSHYFTESLALFPETLTLFLEPLVFSCTDIPAGSVEGPPTQPNIHQNFFS